MSLKDSNPPTTSSNLPISRLAPKIQEDLTTALKEKREIEVSALRMLKAAIFNKEKEKRYKLSKEKSEAELEKMGKESEEAKKLEKESALTDEEVIEVISSEIKKRKEAIDLYEKGNRPELAGKEKKEVEILQSYLPEQLSEEEIKKIAEETIRKVGAEEVKDMGKVMGIITSQVKGKADMSLVSKIVKESLS
jgi:uncharacterized protein YqeY